MQESTYKSGLTVQTAEATSIKPVSFLLYYILYFH